MRVEHLQIFLRGCASVAVVVLLSVGVGDSVGASTRIGQVTGSIRIYGGTSNAPPAGRPSSGRVVFKPAHGTSRAIKVGASGHFTLKLPSGTYSAFGGPPSWRDTCRAKGGLPFKVVAGQTVKVIVECFYAP